MHGRSNHAIVVGLRAYQTLTLEVLAATVTTQPLGPQRFRAMILLPDKRLAMYDLAGDALYMDAHILKWHPWVNLLGLLTSYELDRVAGRYNEVSDERAKPRTAYELARPASIDLFSIARRHLLGPLVDAEYGSAAFVAGTRPARYEVRVSTDPMRDEASFMRGAPAKNATLEAEELRIPTNAPKGDVIHVSMGGLIAQTHYYVGVRAIDDCAHPSALRVAELTTPKRAFATVTPCFVATASTMRASAG